MRAPACLPVHRAVIHHCAPSTGLRQTDTTVLCPRRQMQEHVALAVTVGGRSGCSRHAPTTFNAPNRQTRQPQWGSPTHKVATRLELAGGQFGTAVDRVYTTKDASKSRALAPEFLSDFGSLTGQKSLENGCDVSLYYG